MSFIFRSLALFYMIYAIGAGWHSNTAMVVAANAGFGGAERSRGTSSIPRRFRHGPSVSKPLTDYPSCDEKATTPSSYHHESGTTTSITSVNHRAYNDVLPNSIRAIRADRIATSNDGVQGMHRNLTVSHNTSNPTPFTADPQVPPTARAMEMTSRLTADDDDRTDKMNRTYTFPNGNGDQYPLNETFQILFPDSSTSTYVRPTAAPYSQGPTALPGAATLSSSANHVSLNARFELAVATTLLLALTKTVW